MTVRRIHAIGWATTWLLLAANCNWVESKHSGSPSWGLGRNRMPSWWGQSQRDSGNNNKTIDGDDGDVDREWSSNLYTVNPSKIISLMIRYGGLVIPDSTEKDIDVLSKVCSADCVKLNAVARKLAIYNFTVHLPEDKAKYDKMRSKVNDEDDDENDPRCCLRIGRVYIHWDSYRRPCVEIEVDNVTVTVEFLNVMLTRHNWDELSSHGFPPTFYDDADDDAEVGNETSTFIRIGSIDMSGDIYACLTSRPLRKQIASLTWDLDVLDDFNKDIIFQSEINKKECGRKGCSTDELYLLMRTYFARRAKQFFSETLEDIADGGKMTVDAVNKVVTSTKSNVLKYAGDVGEWTEGQLNDRVASLMQRWGTKFTDRVSDEAQKSVLAARVASHLNATTTRLAAKADDPLKRVFSLLNANKFFTQTP